MSPFYWERHPEGPFATLIKVATNYLDPENYDLDALKSLAKYEDDEEMRIFKSELREALKNPSQLPGNELSESVQYNDGSPEAFLRRLWHDLYGDEPLDALCDHAPDEFWGWAYSPPEMSRYTVPIWGARNHWV